MAPRWYAQAASPITRRRLVLPVLVMAPRRTLLPVVSRLRIPVERSARSLCPETRNATLAALHTVEVVGSNPTAPTNSGEADATEEIGESPIASETVEGRLDVEVHQGGRSLLAGAPEPGEGAVRVSQADIDRGDVVGGDVLGPLALAHELLEHPQGLGPPAR